MSLARGTHVIFDLGEDSDLMRSITTFSRGAGDAEAKVIFDFRVGDGIEETTYTLVEYFSNPAASSTFAVEDSLEYSRVRRGLHGGARACDGGAGWPGGAFPAAAAIPK